MRLGCDHSLIVRWERGDREPAPQDLARLARIFRVGAGELLAGVTLGRGRVASSRSHSRSSRVRLGRRLAEERAMRAVGLWEIFAATGIDGRRVRAIEGGVDPSLGELRALCEAFEVPVGDVLDSRMRAVGGVAS